MNVTPTGAKADATELACIGWKGRVDTDCDRINLLNIILPFCSEDWRRLADAAIRHCRRKLTGGQNNDKPDQGQHDTEAMPRDDFGHDVFAIAPVP